MLLEIDRAMSGGYGGFELLLGKRGPLHLVVVVYAGDGQFRVAAKGPCRIVVARFFSRECGISEASCGESLSC